MSREFGKPVEELQESINSKQFAEYMAMHSLEPFPLEKIELQIAVLCTVVAQSFAGKGKKPKLEDFIIQYDKNQKISEGHMNAFKIEDMLREI